MTIFLMFLLLVQLINEEHSQTSGDRPRYVKYISPRIKYSETTAEIQTPQGKLYKINILNNVIPSLIKEDGDLLELDYMSGWPYTSDHENKVIKYDSYGARGVVNSNFRMPVFFLEVDEWELPFLKTDFDELDPPPLD